MKLIKKSSILLLTVCMLYNSLSTVYGVEAESQPKSITSEAKITYYGAVGKTTLLHDGNLDNFCDTIDNGVDDSGFIFTYAQERYIKKVVIYGDNGYSFDGMKLYIDNKEVASTQKLVSADNPWVVEFDKVKNANVIKIEKVNLKKDQALAEVEIYDTEPPKVLDIVPEHKKINVKQKIVTDLVIDYVTEIAAEDITIEYDEDKLKFLGYKETSGIKLVKSIEETDNGKLRLILASKGESNIVNDKKVLLQLEFKGIQSGEALIDVTKGRVTDGISMEKNLQDISCGATKITIATAAEDVNKDGEFTLLDLGIEARHFKKDPNAAELKDYNTDIVVNGAIDEVDLVEVAKYMLGNANYFLNN